MDDDDWRWMPAVEVFLPTVEISEPEEIGRLYGPSGELLFVLFEHQPFGFV